MNPTTWAQLGFGTAALLAMVYIVRELRAMVRETNTFFGNHLSSLTQSVTALAGQVEKIASVVEVVSERVDRLHDDNTEAASVLRDADAVRARRRK